MGDPDSTNIFSKWVCMQLLIFFRMVEMLKKSWSWTLNTIHFGAWISVNTWHIWYYTYIYKKCRIQENKSWRNESNRHDYMFVTYYAFAIKMVIFNEWNKNRMHRTTSGLEFLFCAPSSNSQPLSFILCVNVCVCDLHNSSYNIFMDFNRLSDLSPCACCMAHETLQM